MSLLSRARVAWTQGRLRRRGNGYARAWTSRLLKGPDQPTVNRLEEYCRNKTGGRGLWKWQHYLEIYERHFAAFRGREIHVMEIGVFSGGSLEMWRDYFGTGATLYGVDIEPDVKAYEGDGVRVFVGDQASPEFWEATLRTIPKLDIVIDDGGHQAHQQIATLEAVLPHMRAGGVFLCEDIHGEANPFAQYVHGLTSALHAAQFETSIDKDLRAPTTPFQSFVHSVHTYPFVTVIEVRQESVDELKAPRLGTEWQPFYEPSHRRPPAITDI